MDLPNGYSEILAHDNASLQVNLLFSLIETQANKSPERIAAIYQLQHLTYGELNERSDRLANHIQKLYQQHGRCVESDILIVLCCDKSLDMLVAMLAVQKAGGAYVPIDPSYPKAMREHILQDTNTLFVLTQSHLTGLFENKESRFLLALDVLVYDELIPKETLTPYASCATQLSHLAYVRYTSGTTGAPKGVLVEHGALSGLIDSFSRLPYFQRFVETSFYTLSLTNYVFDIFELEYGFTLAHGGTLILSDLESAGNDFDKYP